MNDAPSLWDMITIMTPPVKRQMIGAVAAVVILVLVWWLAQ